MAEVDIPAQEPSGKPVKLVPSPFEIWAVREGYDLAPAVLPAANRTYADRQTQAVFEAWNAGSANTTRMVTESTLETEALREKFLALALSE